MPTLVCIDTSPWSLRARLALGALGTAVEVQPYIPVLSEPRLRWKLGRWRGRVTVPVLLRTGAPPIDDSLEIARWANHRAGGDLFAREEDTVRWNHWSDRILDAGRRRTTRRTLADPAALRASLPPAIAALGPVGMAIGRDVARRLLAKYPGGDDASDLAAMRDALTQLHAALQGREHLIGDALSYADLTVAAGLSFVRPHDEHPLGEAARRVWTEPALAAQFGALLDWRDRRLAGHLDQGHTAAPSPSVASAAT